VEGCSTKPPGASAFASGPVKILPHTNAAEISGARKDLQESGNVIACYPQKQDVDGCLVYLDLYRVDTEIGQELGLYLRYATAELRTGNSVVTMNLIVSFVTRLLLSIREYE
jgi:hypothetical protein